MKVNKNNTNDPESSIISVLSSIDDVYPRKSKIVLPKEKFYFERPVFKNPTYKLNTNLSHKEQIDDMYSFFKKQNEKIEKLSKDLLILKLFKYSAKKNDNYNCDFINVDKYLNKLKFDYGLIDKFYNALYKKDLLTIDEIDQLYAKVVYISDFIAGLNQDIIDLKKNYYHEFKIPSLMICQNKSSSDLIKLIDNVEKELKGFKSLTEANDYYIFNSGELIYDMIDELLLIKNKGIVIERHYFLASDAVLKFEYSDWVDLLSRIKFVFSKIKGKVETSVKFKRLYEIIETRYMILSIYKEI